jgi:acyl transferase domain-containing protein
VIVVSGLSGALVGSLPWPVSALPGFAQAGEADQSWLPGLVEAALANAGRAADDLAWQAVGLFRAGANAGTSASELARLWDWCGPALGIDAECAGGLVATLLAVDALTLRQCDLAVVVADNLVVAPAGAVAWDDGCAPLAAAAREGAPRAGAAVLVLEREGEARRRRARIAGGAHRRLGASSGMVGLSLRGITDLLQHVLGQAGLRPADLGYWELHALGTPIGDAVELSALGRVWAKAETGSGRTALGSHKASFGHLEAAAGLVSLARVVACCESGVIPATAWREPFSPLAKLPPALVLSHGGHATMRAGGCFALSRSGVGAAVVLAPID